MGIGNGDNTRIVEHKDDEYWSLGEEWDTAAMSGRGHAVWPQFQEGAESKDKYPSFRAGGYKFHRVKLLIEACAECDFMRQYPKCPRVKDCTCEREWRTMIQDEVHKQSYWPDFPELFNRTFDEFEREWPGLPEGESRLMSFRRGRGDGFICFGGLLWTDGPPKSRKRKVNRVNDYLLNPPE